MTMDVKRYSQRFSSLFHEDTSEEEFQLFREFLKQQYSSENLAFWVEIEDYKLLDDKKQRCKKAKEIYKKYFTAGSQYEVNINSQMKQKVKDNIKEGEKTLFDAIQKSIYKLLEEDCYPKFVKSDMYKKFHAAKQKSPRKPASILEDPLQDVTKELKELKMSVEQILEILKTVEMGDVMEFLSTAEEVHTGIPKLEQYFTKNKEVAEPVTFLKDLGTYLKDYCALLQQLKSTARLERFVTSNRLRKKLEEINFGVHIRLDKFLPYLAFEMELQEEDKQEGQPEVPKEEEAKEEDQDEEDVPPPTVEKTDEDDDEGMPPVEAISFLRARKATFVPASEMTITRKRFLTRRIFHEEDQEKIDVFVDLIGKKFWEEYFDLKDYWVDWTEFMVALQTFLKTSVTAEEEKVLKYLIDNANLGVANQHKFSEFLKAFGPMKSDTTNCIKTMKLILRERWFYGFLSKSECEHLLTNEPTGTFLLRFSKSRAGSFALAFTAKKKVYHILINSCKPVGFKVFENATKTERTFTNLGEIIKSYSYALKQPFISSLPFQPWFQGDLSSLESNELLAGKPVVVPAMVLLRLPMFPSSKLSLMKWLINLLTDVALHESENSMNAKNLAIVIAPNLRSVDGASMDSLVVSQKIVQFLQQMILHEVNTRNS